MKTERTLMASNGVRARDRFLLRNQAFVRQGEWFFVPEKWKHVPELLVRRNEPIRRGAGKPHIVEWLYREGGERVYVCSRHPLGVSEGRYSAMVRSDPSLLGLNWRLMARNPKVYARGTVRHPDHATITLREWCRVFAEHGDRSAIHAPHGVHRLRQATAGVMESWTEGVLE